MYVLKCLIGVFLGICSLLQAQSLDRFVIGTTGGSASSVAGQLEFTVGEPATLTLESGTFILNQGFQQSNPPYNVATDPEIRVEYSLYPNPTTSIVNLELSLEKAADIQIDWLDVRGRKTGIPARIWVRAQQIQEKFDLRELPTGIYLLKISSASGEVAKTLRVEKLE